MGSGSGSHNKWGQKERAQLQYFQPGATCTIIFYAGKVSSQKFLKVLHGKQIKVQATAAEDNEKAPKLGKAPVITGPPVGQCSDKQAKPVRHKPKGKRVHNLSLNITKGQNNAGKW